MYLLRDRVVPHLHLKMYYNHPAVRNLANSIWLLLLSTRIFRYTCHKRGLPLHWKTYKRGKSSLLAAALVLVRALPLLWEG